MSARDFLHAAFHDPRTHAYRVVESIVWTLILLSIGVLIAEPFFDEGSRGDEILRRIDRTLLWMFAVEVGTRILTFRPPELQVFNKPPLGRLRTEIFARIRFALTPMMLVDILTVLALVPALRGLRVLRLLRLLRTAELFRYANPFQGLTHAFEEDRLLFTFAFSVLGVETILGGISLFLVERNYNEEINSVGDGLWWALVTITTVGFGDITPVTTVGRFIGGAMMIGGLFTLALFAGIVGHSLLNAVLSIREEQFRMSGYVNHIVVCGYEMGSGMLLDVLSSEINFEDQRVVFARELSVAVRPQLSMKRTKQRPVARASVAPQEVDGAGGAVNHGDAVEKHARGQRAQHEVLQARLLAGDTACVHRCEHVCFAASRLIHAFYSCK